ncbi:conserved hypothetical protein [Serratia proteamaculans]|nr:conserved hypothetical protein [Serratia proteamaculans]
MPEVKLARNDGFNTRVLKELTGTVEGHKRLFLEAWNEYFS